MPATVPTGNSVFAGTMEAAGIEPANDSYRPCIGCGTRENLVAHPTERYGVVFICAACLDSLARRPSVYAIRGADRIKIGVSDDPGKRLRDLQVGNPNRLELLAVLDGGREREAQLHAELTAHRVQGEWFEDVPTVRAALGLEGAS